MSLPQPLANSAAKRDGYEEKILPGGLGLALTSEGT